MTERRASCRQHLQFVPLRTLGAGGMDEVYRATDRFLALAPERTGTGSVTVVQNWLAALATRR